MKDPVFINEMLQYGQTVAGKVKKGFTGITVQQLNWKPNEQSWSIGQCLDHLIISDSAYFANLKKITEGQFNMSFWERWNPLNGAWGRLMVKHLQEKPRGKMKAPKLIRPSTSDIDAGILERFDQHLDIFLNYIDACMSVDLDKTHISSPITKFITYSLRNAIKFLIQHEHRHINQAIKVKHNAAFP